MFTVYNGTVFVQGIYYNHCQFCSATPRGSTFTVYHPDPLITAESILRLTCHTLSQLKSVRHHFPVPFHAEIHRIGQEPVLRKWQLQYP